MASDGQRPGWQYNFPCLEILFIYAGKCQQPRKVFFSAGGRHRDIVYIDCDDKGIAHSVANDNSGSGCPLPLRDSCFEVDEH